ncbi:MAG: hypothetical protein K0Q79_1761 [Flavipsychrobacter sp.]|jgi:hypothetical protein|nr:hypothetical protein [Flavipsychrobacter sp.]
MALNPNHAFEDIGEVKCAIVEKNCTPERTDFIKRLLEHNGFEVVLAKSPPPKVAAKPAPKPAAPPAEGAAPEVAAAPSLPPEPPLPPPPDTYTVGVTDVTFSPINAVFNRELKTFDGAVVTSDYWKQREAAPKEDEWYWKK